MLDFTQGRLGEGIPLSCAQVDLAPLLTEIASELELSHPGRTLQVHCSGEATGWMDGERVAQAVENLAQNALAHGAPDAPVRIEASTHEDAVTISVQNHGPPIPEALLPHLFDAFHQRSRSKGGLGLGLYIVREIVTGHGGRVDVRSSEETTTFTITLPRVCPSAERDPQ